MVKLRRAEAGDWAALYAWRNDAATRAESRSGGVVRLAEHVAWLKDRLTDSSCHLFVGYDTEVGLDVGTVRVDVGAGEGKGKRKREAMREGEVSVTVDPHLRGRGYATRMLSALTDLCREEQLVDRLVARVKGENYPSLRAFAAAGYGLDGEEGELAVLRRQV